VLRTALLFLRSAVRFVYAELAGPVAVCSPKHSASWVIESLGGARIVEHRRVQRAPPHRSVPHPRYCLPGRPKAKPRHPKELVSAMTKCHRTIEIIRGVPTGDPCSKFPNALLRTTDPSTPTPRPRFTASDYLKQMARLGVTHA
jgi:hypothetical protein